MAERFLNWFVRLFRQNWVTLVLVAGMVSILVYSLSEANWVKDQDQLNYFFFVGMGFGWLLARSRFSGLFALFYGLFISIIIALQGIGKILPTLGQIFSTPPGALINEMNLRAVTLSLRMNGWVDTLNSGENIQDTGLFVFLMGVILSLCSIWLVWSLVRQRRVLNGLLPIGLLLAVNIHLSRQPLTNYMVFLFCALLLVARTSFNRQHEDWQRRRVDYPDQLGLEWGGAALAMVLVVVLVARAAPLFGTSEGWRALSDWVARFHTRTSDTATRLFSGVNPPPPPPDMKPQIYVNTPNMGQIGAPISQGFGTIMWVSVSDPAPIPRDVGINVPMSIVHLHYWRNGIYATYTGRGWEIAPLSGSISKESKLPETPTKGHYFLKQEYELEALHTGALFSVNEPVQTGQGVYLRQSPVDGKQTQILEGQVSKYQVISESTDVTADELVSAPADYPASIRSTYLQLPDSLPPRVRTLSQRVIQGAQDPYHKALLIQNYLRENFKYDLNVKEPPGKRDVVDYFLFDAQAGFCSHYATAMTVMLRAVGVPARVVTGYAMGDYDQSKAAFRVPESAAHAWVEVYFPGYGWIEFEPTVGRTPFQYFESGPRARITPEVLGNLEKKPTPKTQPYLLALVAVAALALLSMPFLLLRMFTTTRQPPNIQIDVLYRRMRRLLGWAGLEAVPSTTPDEYLAQYGSSLEPYDQLSQALVQVTSLYRETVYSPHPPDQHRMRRASQLWQKSFGDWAVLWLRAAWQRLRQKATSE